MTIDEVIRIENKIAEENQKIVDTQIVFDDVSLSQLYCDDTEVIEEHLENYKKCAEYHKKIAEWLEELKMLRELKDEHRKIGNIEGFNQGYRKAIDDFAEKLKRKNKETIPTHSGYCRMSFDEVVDEIAEQLKEGEK